MLGIDVKDDADGDEGENEAVLGLSATGEPVNAGARDGFELTDVDGVAVLGLEL